MLIKLVASDRARICENILRSLPKWFGIESSILNYIRDVETMPMVAAYDGDSAVGFVSLKMHSPDHYEMFVLGVLPQFHRQGVGRELVAAAEKFASDMGSSFLSVKTISPSSPNQEYAQTREFYAASGFRPLEEFKNIWGAENPCLLMIKCIHSKDSPP